MLNFIYYPISGILWFWRKVLSLFMDPNSGVTWLLAIILMTWTIKALLVKPMVDQMRMSRRMQEIQPKMQAIRDKYKNDKAKQAEETQKLYKEMGFNPMAGCIPMLVQIPVFIGLFHVLRSFNRTGTHAGGLGMSVEENRNTANYFFPVADVQSFLDARVFGAPLSASINMRREAYDAFQPVDFTRTDIMWVAVPMIIAVTLMTHFNARYTLDHQKARVAAGKVQQPTGENAAMMQAQQDMMGKMMLWVMPAFTILTGYAWSIGLLVYMTSNVLWTFVQTRLVFKKMDQEEEAELAARKEAQAASAPAPGARKLDKKSKGQRAKENIAAEEEKRAQQIKERKAAEKARSQEKKKK